MAKNPDNVMRFLNDLLKKLEEPAKKELLKLLELKEREKEQRKEHFDGKINSWDWR